MAYAINLSLYKLAARKQVKRDTMVCLKCLESPKFDIISDFSEKYAYGYTIMLQCKCAMMRESVADGMDGKVSGKIADALVILVNKWNESNLATLGMPCNTAGLVQ